MFMFMFAPLADMPPKLVPMRGLGHICGSMVISGAIGDTFRQSKRRFSGESLATIIYCIGKKDAVCYG